MPSTESSADELADERPTPSFAAQPDEAIAKAQAKSLADTPDDTASLSDSAYQRFWKTTELNTRSQRICGGYYQLPQREAQSDSLSFNQELPVEITSDFANLRRDGESHIYGDVIIQQGANVITTDNAYISLNPRQLRLYKNILVSNNDYAVQADQGQYNQAQQSSVFNEAYLVAPALNARAYAKTLENQDTQTLTLHDARYTTCAPSESSWMINASEIQLDTESGFSDVYDLTLYVAETPILYLPYFRFPIDDRRHTGLLYPLYSYSSQDGHGLALPFYVNIAPQYDLTVVPRWIQQRGLMAESEFRYLLGSEQLELGEGSIGGSYIPDDELYGDDRHYLTADYQLSNRRWNITGEYNAVSDADYLYDINTYVAPSRLTYLDQRAQASYLLNHGLVSLGYKRYEILSATSNPYTQEPQLNIQYNYPFLNNFSWDSQVNIGRYEREEPVPDEVKGDRYYFSTGLSYHWLGRSFFVSPSLKVKHLRYTLEGDSITDETPSIWVPQATLDSGLIFERPVEHPWFSGSHTLEPRLFLNYAAQRTQTQLPNFDTTLPTFNYAQLFRDNRYAGYDRIGDNRSLSLAVSSRWLEDSGRELGSMSLGQIIYFSDRSIALQDEDNQRARSSYAFRANFNPTNQLSSFAELTWDDFTDEWRESHFNISYQASQQLIGNVGLHFTPDTHQQIQLSGVYQLTPNWQIFGQTRHEFEEQKNIESLAGVEWQNCCSVVRLAGARTLSRDSNDAIIDENRLLLEFELKGLGAVGNDLQKNLSNLIKGYRSRD